jgi:hypothetical protein
MARQNEASFDTYIEDCGSLPDLMLQVTYRPLEALRTNPRNARTHSKRQIGKLADAIRRFGFTNRCSSMRRAS